MLNDFISLLFPHCCVVSKQPLARGEKWISTSYAASLPKFDLHNKNEKLERKFSGLVQVRHVLAYYKFSRHSGAQKILHQIKYKNTPELGELCGKWFAHSLVAAGYTNTFDIVLPIPLHKAKLRKRGYNQAYHIAKGMAEVLNIACDQKSLYRKVNTTTQTKKGRMERFDNTANIYAITKKAPLKGKRVLVVDDVITTGATMIQCVELLRRSGCTDISVAGLAAVE